MNESDIRSSHFISHLKELRSRIIFCFTFLILGFIGCWIFSDHIMSIVVYPIKPYLLHNEGKLIFTAPMDEFLSHFKISIYGAFVLSFPFLIYQVWKFLAPGLYKEEKGFISLFTLLGSLLFFLGTVFVYFIVYPLSFNFLLNFGSSLPMISIKEYLSFFIRISLVFGLLFEMPLIITSLVWMRVINIETLKSNRRYAIIGIAIIAAFVTPPDVISMILLLIPLYLLYELSIFISSKISYFLKED